MSVGFLPIASSSKGNCTYICSDSSKILIDCGISAKRTTSVLQNHNINVEDINGIFITHEHTDHVSGAGVLARKYKIPIYATSETWEFIENNNKIGKVDDRLKNHVYKGEQCIIDNIKIFPFGISHDAVDPVGYNVLIEDKKISVCTDLGVETKSVIDKLSNSNIVLIESNYDLEMLKKGCYPSNLKRRVLGDRGHLSNVDCAELLLKTKNENIEHLYLGHLSDDNNKPILAFQTVKNILEYNKFKDVKINLAQSGHLKPILNI